MLISLSVLTSAMEKYEKKKKKIMRENEAYSRQNMSPGGAGMSLGLLSGFMMVAILFFVLELILVFYAVMIALRCTTGGAERMIHLVLAIIFTLPYMLINLVFNRCAVGVIRNEPVEVPKVTDLPMGYVPGNHV